jgi:cellulose biosynthesis protein BcsQ
MKIIAFITQKGEFGKTTCTMNIGAGLNTLIDNRDYILIDYPPNLMSITNEKVK